MNKLFTVIFVSIFLPFLFLINILFILSPTVFEFLYPKFTVSDTFGWSLDVQQKQAKDVVGMILHEQQFQTDSLSQKQITLTENEQGHMNDVTTLLKSAKIGTAFLGGILVALITKAYSTKKITRPFSQKLLKSAFIVYIAMSIIACFVIFSMWTTFFITLHELLFTQGNWSFPENSTLIRLFPEVFWQKTSVLLILLPAIECGILFICTLFPSKSLKNDKILA